MTQDEIVTEAVARALCQVSRADPDALGVDRKPRWKGWAQYARAAIAAMSTAQEPALDDDAEWRLLAGDLCRAMRIDVGEITLHWAETFLRSIAERLQSKAPETGKTLASEGRCHCGFWPCPTHQIDDISEAPETGEG
jgi:hypothetical protein